MGAEGLPVSHREGVPGFQCMGCSFQSIQLVEQQHVECNQHHQANRRTKKTNQVLNLLPGLIQRLQQSVFHLHTQQCKFRTGKIHPDTNGCGANNCSMLHPRTGYFIIFLFLLLKMTGCYNLHKGHFQQSPFPAKTPALLKHWSQLSPFFLVVLFFIFFNWKFGVLYLTCFTYRCEYEHLNIKAQAWKTFKRNMKFLKCL